MSDYDLQIERFAWTPDYGTFGLLSLKDQTWYTLERPWLGNVVNVSCIPEGIYTVKLDLFYKPDGTNYACYQIMDVPGRTLIKMHRANIVTELKGCVALGTSLGRYKGMWSVAYSKKALDKFMSAMGGRDEATLKIGHIEPGGVI